MALLVDAGDAFLRYVKYVPEVRQMEPSGVAAAKLDQMFSTRSSNYPRILSALLTLSFLDTNIMPTF